MISIIALLIALLLPALQAARAAATNLSCESSVRQMGVALLAYTNDHKDYLIPGAVVGGDWTPPNWLPYYFVLMPYMGGSGAESIYANPQPGLAWRMCPSNPLGPGETITYDTVGYGWNHANFGLSYNPSNPTQYGYGTRLSEVPNPAQTVILGDSKDSGVISGDANAYQYRYQYYTTEYMLPYRHNNGGYFLYLDWHVAHHEASWVIEHREVFEWK